MNKFTLALGAIVCALGAMPSVRAQALPAPEPLDRIVAIAEDDVILQSELDRAVQQILTQYRNSPQQLPPRTVLDQQVLDRLIMNRLQVQRAQSTGIRVTDADVDQAISRIAANNRLDATQLRASLARDGIDYDEFRKSIRDQILIDRMHQRVVQGAGNISDAEVDAAIASGNVKSGEIHLAHILIATPENASTQQIEAARAKADEAKKAIDEGLDFNAAAIRYSNAQDALDGGDLGWRAIDTIPEAFVQIAEGLQPGQVSQVIRGPNGFHIIKLVEKRADSQKLVTEYHARHIEIGTTELVSSADAQKKAEDIRRRIVDGHEDFAKLAKEFSNDTPTANLGGDMGWFPIDQYGPKVAEILAPLKDGDVSPAFQTDVGWHILQLIGKRTEDRTEQIKHEQARDMLRQRKGDDDYENFLRTVRAESYICTMDAIYSSPGVPVCAAGGDASPKNTSAKDAVKDDAAKDAAPKKAGTP